MISYNGFIKIYDVDMVVYVVMVVGRVDVYVFMLVSFLEYVKMVDGVKVILFILDKWLVEYIVMVFCKEDEDLCGVIN